MRILLISNMYPSPNHPDFGIFVKNITMELQESGHSVIKCVRFDKCEGKFNKLLSYAFFYLKAFFYMLFCKYDYAYCHYVSHTALPVLCARQLKRNVRIVSHIHGGDAKLLKGRNRYFHKIKSFLVQQIMDKSIYVICPSFSYAKYLQKVFFLEQDKLVVYPSGGVQECFYPSGKHKESSGKLTIGYAGRLVKSKNVELIIESIKGLTDVELKIVGEGEMEARLRDVAKGLKNVTFFRPLSHNDLADWFRGIDVLIYPSDSESLGLVPLEAMATGVYCILSRIPAFLEFEENGLNFSLLDDIDQLSIRKEIYSYLSLDDKYIKDVKENNSFMVRKIYGAANIKGALNGIFK